MSVNKSIRNCFKELIVSLPYEKITVSLICKKAAVSRAAFYDSFPNKEAILRSIVEDDIINPQKTLLHLMTLNRFKSSAQIATELLYAGIQQNADLCKCINRIENGALLIRLLTDGFMVICEDILEKCDLQDDERRYATFFFAATNAFLIGKWLDNDMDIDPARLGQLYNKWTLHYWQRIIPLQLEWA